tara:strand:+ start:6985 stop:7176 length:192 start_codon:yes stop_codon:yes gene_type:complete
VLPGWDEAKTEGEARERMCKCSSFSLWHSFKVSAKNHGGVISALDKRIIMLGDGSWLISAWRA